MPSYLRGREEESIVNQSILILIHIIENQAVFVSPDKTNHKTTPYDHSRDVFILLWSEPSTRCISHWHALSHVPLDLRCFNGPTYELDRKVVVLLPRCAS
ncbi:hypothetical protein GQ53DRAFT_749649 [Thozetella sp. PMI_491]|nr:hypothetical protein GQ53DRAFT_749649 [Thozetella sp. PMI_491]